MKKIIVGIVALAFLLVGNSTFAAGWNQYPTDCPAINIGNDTTGQGISTPCWYGTSISATAGQVVKVKVFYDNTNGVAANNTTISINQSPSGSTSSTNFNFSGNLTSSAGSLPLSQVTANLTSSQTLIFSQAKWYKNGSGTPVGLPGGQTGIEALSGGLNLGTIPNAEWGNINFSFIVGNTTPPPPNCTISNFNANPTSVTSGSPVTLNWNTSNCTTVTVTGPNGLVSSNLNGPTTIYPNLTGTYTINASGASGPASPQSTTVIVTTVQPPSCVINSFTANPTSVTSGSPVTLNWNTSNCTNATVSSPTGPVSSNLNGPTTIYPTTSGTYTINAYGTNGQAQPLTVYISVNSTQTYCTIINFNVNGQQNITVQSGASVNLNWNTSNCTTANITGPTGTISNNLNGPLTIYPTSSGTYTITASGMNGQASPQTVYINVNSNQNYCTITNFTANGSSYVTVQSGAPVYLVWNTSNCTYATVSGMNMSTNYNLSGTQTVYPTYSGTYTISASGTNGSPSQTININVNGNNNNSYCTISNFTANNQTSTSIQSGAPVTIYWNTYDCTSVNITGQGIYSYNSQLSGSQTVYPTYSGTYTINAYGTNGSPSRSVYVTVNPIVSLPLPPVYTNTCAVTSVATNVTRNSATLNGIITSSTGASYFEYGNNVTLGSRTVSRTANGLFNEFISGLAPNTYYYFRPVAQCSGGISYGNIEVFRTLGNIVTTNTVRQVVVQGTTVIGTESPIMLKIENRYQSIAVGDIVDYTVTYKNIGKTLLTHPVLQVIIPKGITLINASRGTYAADTNTLTVPLEDLVPGVEGVVFLQGHVDAILSNTSQVVTTAILVYTNPNGAQENAIAYVLNNPREIVGNNLGAAAFGAGFLNIGLIGWLLILILILLIVLATRRSYASKH